MEEDRLGHKCIQWEDVDRQRVLHPQGLLSQWATIWWHHAPWPRTASLCYRPYCTCTYQGLDFTEVKNNSLPTFYLDHSQRMLTRFMNSRHHATSHTPCSHCIHKNTLTHLKPTEGWLVSGHLSHLSPSAATQRASLTPICPLRGSHSMLITTAPISQTHFWTLIFFPLSLGNSTLQSDFLDSWVHFSHLAFKFLFFASTVRGPSLQEE